MNRRTVLYVCHNHPAVRAGGAEQYALELHRGMRSSMKYQPVFLSRYTDPAPVAVSGVNGLSSVNGESDELFFHVPGTGFDDFLGTYPDKEIYTQRFDAVLRAYRPDVVHFQHTLFLGYDMVRQVRNTLPDTAVVYTLQEFLPICHRQGQMVRATDNRPCTHDSPRRCHECFPDISQEAFFLRKRLIQSHLQHVDLFIAPSHYLREQYIRWGIPIDKIRFEEYGRSPDEPVEEVATTNAQARFGFFGQVTQFKGIQVLLEAMQIVKGMNTPVQLTIHGTPMEQVIEPFRSELRRVFEQCHGYVTHLGSYVPADLPELMSRVDWVVVPSIWWENSPLVIQEAFHHGKPLICSDIGGMKEKVMDGVNGLHFRAGDARSLADVLQRAATDPGLRRRLRGGIARIYSMNEHVRELETAYDTLLARHAPAPQGSGTVHSADVVQTGVTQ